MHLGCSDEEKFNPQAVSFDINIEFFEAPKAIYTDNLNDSCCYYKISKNIKSFCKEKRFNLIEKLCFDVHNVVKNSVDLVGLKIKNITVETTKLSPPIPNIYGGSCFIYSEDIKIDEIKADD